MVMNGQWFAGGPQINVSTSNRLGIFTP